MCICESAFSKVCFSKVYLLKCIRLPNIYKSTLLCMQVKKENVTNKWCCGNVALSRVMLPSNVAQSNGVYRPFGSVTSTTFEGKQPPIEITPFK